MNVVGQQRSEPNYQVYYQNSASMAQLEDKSVDLVVTSPPYPMIEMWNDQFIAQDERIDGAFASDQPDLAFQYMHEQINNVLGECYRVLKSGGITCINIGDATYKNGENFQLYSNHTEIIKNCLKLGFQQLPSIIWRKPGNSPNKFMGSGMLPPNAYVTLEHEHILIFRKGGKRAFTDKEKANRRKSAYWWEERNQWFSDIWTDIKGEKQSMIDKEVRERSAAFPFEIPYRLINMFSVQGDTVLDPYLRTGTTIVAALASGRHGIGYEIERGFERIIDKRIEGAPELARKTNLQRLQKHREFIDERSQGGKLVKYKNENYEVGCMTSQEVDLKFLVPTP